MNSYFKVYIAKCTEVQVICVILIIFYTVNYLYNLRKYMQSFMYNAREQCCISRIQG